MKWLKAFILIFLASLAANQSLWAQCSFSFTASDTVICEKEAVVFTLVNKPSNVKEVLWDVGFKQIKNVDKPTFVFPNYGTYDLSLTITLNDNSSCAVTKTGHIEVNPIPAIGAITQNKTELCKVGDEVVFTNTSKNAVKWIWSIEGKYYESNKPSVSHKADYTGYPIVQLTVESNKKCRNSFVFDSLIQVLEKPTVDLSASNLLLCTLPGVLKPDVQYDFKGTTISSFVWNFKGATFNSDFNQKPKDKTYAKPGQFDIELEMKSNTGCSYKYNFANIVQVIDFSTVKVEAIPLTAKGCNTMKYKVLVSGIDTNLVDWEYDDKNVSWVDSSYIDSTVFFFKNEGTHTLNLVVNKSPCIRKFPVKVIAKKGEVIADFLQNGCHCKVPDTISATNKSYIISGGYKPTYEWTVLGGLGFKYVSTDVDLEMVTGQKGSYVIILRAYDKNGCYDVEAKRVKVNEYNIKSDYIDDETCLKHQFYLPEDSFCGANEEDFNWYFYDENNKLVSHFNEVRPNVTFPFEGIYSVAVSVKSKNGCFDSTYLDKYIYAQNCFDSLRFAFEGDSGCVGKIELPAIVNYGNQISVKAHLILQSDTSVRYSGTYSFPSLTFIVKKPGIYNLKVELTAFDGSVAKSFYFKDMARVNQLKITGKIGKTTGCFPNKKTELIVKSVENIMFWNKGDTSVSTLWRIFPSEKGKIDKPNARFAVLTSFETGQVDVELQGTNSTACVGVWQSVNKVNENLNPDFKIPKDACYGDTIIIENKSTGSGVVYSWSSSNVNDIFWPNNLVENPEFKPLGEGKRNVILTVTDSNGCKGSVQKSLNLVDIQLDFSVDDTTAQCSPATYMFTIKAKNAQEFEWEFGDGEKLTTKQKSVYKIYDLRRINPYKYIFSVKLTGKHPDGCEQSVFKKDLIKINGPWPNFEISNNIGCSPLSTNFVDKSENIAKMYFDYGDNSNIDTIINANHIYSTDTTNEFEVFKPYVIATDKFDCRVGFFLNDSIKVYTPPKARFGGNPKVGCDPLQVGMASRSRFAKAYNWYIPNNNFTTIGKSAKTTLNEGKYGLQLTVKNAIGCTDVLYKPDFYLVHARPKAAFLAKDTIGCLGYELEFGSTSFSYAKITQYQWHSGIGDIWNDSALTPVYKPKMSETGLLNVRLIVQDENSCTDTFIMEKAAKIYTKLPVNSPSFSYVSHTKNTEIELEWNQTQAAYFRDLSIFNTTSNVANKLIFSAGPKDTRFLYAQDSLAKQSNCFKIELTDKCREVYPSITHCSVHLDVDKTNKTATKLNWNHYVGWDSIALYRIYRAEKSSDFIHLANVPGWVSTYTDSSFCDSTYQYKIIALSATDPVRSQSNSLQHKTNYTYQNVPLEITLTTVAENNEIRTHWQPSIQLGALNYEVSKREHLGVKNLVWQTTNDTFIIDRKAEVQNYHYTYRIRVRDKCGYVSKKSNQGRSILLNVNQRENSVIPFWNQYEYWQNGVKNYVVQVKAPNEKWFTDLGTTSDTFYNDEMAFLKYKEPYSYRIKAIENGENPDTSYSNIREIIPVPSIFAPSAFSPNGDGVNDTFWLKGWALVTDSVEIEAFNLKIFNRWGERVFESNNLHKGWDGTFKNEMVQLDQYIWLAKATALNGKIYFLRGGVLVLR